MAQAKLRASSKAIQKTRGRQLRAINQNQPRSTKKPRTIVPPPQSTRIMQRYAGGESIRQIAREEQRDRATVTKIVRSDEMQTFVQKMRERFYGLGFDALDAVQHALQVQKNAGIGYRLLTDIGIIPSAEERHAIAIQPIAIDMVPLTPFEAAMVGSEDGQMKRIAYQCACVLEEGAKNFGTSLPTPDEVRHLRKVAEVADEITGGQFHEICMRGGPEEKRIRQLADDLVKNREDSRSLPGHRSQLALPRYKQAAIADRLATRN
jgi:hypothetical protein